MSPLSTRRCTRWGGMVLIVVVGLLALHLPHYLAETASPTDYATDPGPLLVATMLGAVLTALAVARGRRWGWILGIGVATLSCVLYLVQETIGLPGLSQTWWEPTRLFSLLLAGLFIVLAVRQLRERG